MDWSSNKSLPEIVTRGHGYKLCKTQCVNDAVEAFLVTA